MTINSLFTFLGTARRCVRGWFSITVGGIRVENGAVQSDDQKSFVGRYFSVVLHCRDQTANIMVFL